MDPDNIVNDGASDVLEQPKKRKKTLAQSALEGNDYGDVEAQLQSLFSEMDDVTFDITIQKYNPQTKSYPQIASYKDVADIKEILSTEDIGKTYGGGKYKLVVRYEGEDGKFEHWTRVFELDKAYDRFSQASVNPDKGQSYSNTSNQMSAGDLFALMSAQNERTMQMMMTMMQSSQNAMATMVTAMANAKPADANTELLKEIIKNSKTDPAAQMQVMVKTMQDLKTLAEPRIEEYEDDEEEDEEEDLADPNLMGELGKAVVPAITGILGLDKQQPPQQQTGAA